MAFRLAKPGDEPALIAFLQRQPLYNLFLLGNLARHGVAGPDLDFWMHERSDGEIAGVVNRWLTFWSIGHGEDPRAFDAAAAAAVIDGYPREQVQGMTGVPDEVEPLLAALRRHRPRHVQQERFAALEGAPAPAAHRGASRRAEPKDLDALAALYDDPAAGRMRRGRPAVERMIAGRTYLVEDEGAVVCACGVFAETHRAGMIGGVYTPERFRRRGYATSLVHFVSAELVAEGKRPCLFYANPEAGRIYLRLGFRDLGPWRLVDF